MTNSNDLLESAFSAVVGSTQAIFVNLAPSLPSLFILVSACCKIAGAALFFHAILRLRLMKHKSNPEPLGPILWQMIFCVMLINLNLTIASGVESFFSTNEISPLSNMLAENNLSEAERSKNIIMSILAFIQFVGYISVAKGIFELNKVANNKTQSSLGKGLTHIVGGIFASNILLTASMLSATFLPGGSL